MTKRQDMGNILTRITGTGKSAEKTTTSSTQHTSGPSNQLTGKTTFYLSEDVIDRLEKEWMTRRQQNPRNRRLGKSFIVNEILGEKLPPLEK